MDWTDPDYAVDHHLLPEQFQDYFESHKLDIDNHTVTVTNDEHHSIHPTWNHEWDAYIADHPNSSPEEILNQAAEMMEDYGILDRYIHEYGEGTGAIDFEP